MQKEDRQLSSLSAQSLLESPCGGFHKNGGPQYRVQNTIMGLGLRDRARNTKILIIGFITAAVLTFAKLPSLDRILSAPRNLTPTMEKKTETETGTGITDFGRGIRLGFARHFLPWRPS